MENLQEDIGIQQLNHMVNGAQRKDIIKETLEILLLKIRKIQQ
jgi:hypothetical protein